MATSNPQSDNPNSIPPTGNDAALPASGSLSSINPMRALSSMLVLGILAGVAGGPLINESHGILATRSPVLAKYRKLVLGISAKYLAGFIVAKDQLHVIDTALTMGLLGMIFCGLIGLGCGILGSSY